MFQRHGQTFDSILNYGKKREGNGEIICWWY